MVVVVAAVLAFAAIKLQPMQSQNVTIEKMGAIVGSIGQGQNADQVADKQAYIRDEFKKYITHTFFVNAQGEQTDASPEEVLNSLGKLPEVFEAKTAMPVFQAQLGDSTLYVVPMSGKGLWGPVWGYVALNSDCNTIYGAKFDHKGETPGLGAEISTPAFSDQFKGKKLFDNDKFMSVNLVKGVATTPYEVDAISGGTLTSNGVKAMLQTCLGDYVPFFKKIQQTIDVPITDTVEMTPVVVVDSL